MGRIYGLLFIAYHTENILTGEAQEKRPNNSRNIDNLYGTFLMLIPLLL